MYKESMRPKSNRKLVQRLFVKIKSDRKANSVGVQVTTNTILLGQGTSVSIDNSIQTRGNGGTSVRVIDTADFHSLDGKTGVLGLDGGDIEARPARVSRRSKVEFTPGSSVATIFIDGDRRTLGRGPTTLRVGIKGVVLGFSSTDRELMAGISVPSVPLTIPPNLVPDHNVPVPSLGASELHNVLVIASLGGLDGDDVATIRTAYIANVTIAPAAGFGSFTEANCREFAR